MFVDNDLLVALNMKNNYCFIRLLCKTTNAKLENMFTYGKYCQMKRINDDIIKWDLEPDTVVVGEVYLKFG